MQVLGRVSRTLEGSCTLMPAAAAQHRGGWLWQQRHIRLTAPCADGRIRDGMAGEVMDVLCHVFTAHSPLVPVPTDAALTRTLVDATHDVVALVQRWAWGTGHS